MIQSWQNLVTDGRTDRQIDESDFTGRCPTNIERLKAFKSKMNFSQMEFISVI